MPTEAERLELIAERLASLFNGERAAKDSNPTCANIYNGFLKEIGREEFERQGGPDLDSMLKEIQHMEKLNEGKDGYSLPSNGFFYGVGWLAYAKQDEIADYDGLHQPLGEMVSDKKFRAICPPIFFSWCILLLEKLAVVMDHTAKSPEFVKCADKMLNAVLFYLIERTDIKPPKMIMDNGLRIMHSLSKVVARILASGSDVAKNLRTFVTRCLRTRELPFDIQETCYKLTYQAAWLLGTRFWKEDEQFVRLVAAMCAIHWRMMLEGLANRAPLETAHLMFTEVFHVCEGEEGDSMSDATATAVANNCKNMMETVAGYIKGEDQNPEPINASQRYIVAALVSTLAAADVFEMIHKDDRWVIIDWWLKHSQEQSDVFRQLMLCSTSVKQLDTRVMSAIAAYYERVASGVQEADMMALEWTLQLIKEQRTDFYDKASLSDCVARLERVRVPKKFLDALKKLKC